MSVLHMLECVFNLECNVWLGGGGILRIIPMYDKAMGPGAGPSTRKSPQGAKTYKCTTT
jgi:hypothetical protein